MSKPQRNLDGIYFRIERDGKCQNVCYSDMTKDERDEIAETKARQLTSDQMASWWRSMAELLADQLYDIGEQFDLMGE